MTTMFTARPLRARWHRPVALVFIMATMVGGLVDVAGSARAAEATSRITGLIFEDLDEDGVFDTGDTPWADHTLYLYDASGSYLASATSDASGAYRFDGLTDGDYRVEYASHAWWGIREDWVPTTTDSVRPSHTLTLTGDARADFGWRPIVTSTDVSAPVSEVVAANGLRVASYNDAVDAQTVLDALLTGHLIGDEAAHTTVRFGYSSSSSCSTGVAQYDGVYQDFNAACYVSYVSWLDGGDRTLFHEYGHAWGYYHAYEVQQDPTLASYLEARGLTGDDRLDTSHGWSRHEILAEDYRHLFGSANARPGGQLNRDIPLASEVPGLEEFLSTTFVTVASDATTDPVDEPTDDPTSEPEPTSDPTPEDTVAPDVQVTSPADGERVSGTVVVRLAASDEVDPEGSLTVAVAVDGGAWSPATFNASTGAYELAVDTTVLKQGSHTLAARATDAAGNLAEGPGVTIDVKNKGGGNDDTDTTGKGGGNGRGPNK